jgi:hypothetical protein
LNRRTILGSVSFSYVNIWKEKESLEREREREREREEW